MSPQTYENLQIINGNYTLAGFAAIHQHFPLFPHLPEDIRLLIWRTSLQRERMLHIHIHPIKLASSEADNTPVCPDYRIAARGNRALSKTLHVSSEARRAALSFYRVHIPICTFTHADPENAAVLANANMNTPSGIFLPFNPEHDILQLTASIFLTLQPAIMLQSVLLNLRALDPRGIGLRKLALDVSNWPPPSSDDDETQTVANAPSSFTQLLAGLEEILFITTVILNRLLVAARPRQHVNPACREIVFLNRDMPLCADTALFTRLERDPRPIEADLRRGFTEQGLLRAQRMAARALSGYLGARLEDVRTARLGWLLASKPRREVDSRETAEVFVKEEAGREPSRVQELGQLVNRYLGSETADINLENVVGSAGMAFGYWMFPIDILSADVDGAREEEEEEEEEEDNGWEFDFHWLMRPFQDLSQSWPELWLMELD